MIVRCFTGTGGQRNFRKSLAPRAIHTKADLQQWLGQVSPEEPVVVVAHRLLSERLRAVAELLPAAVYDARLDIDNLHRMRVSVRRAQTALHLFREILPKRPRRWVRRRLRKIQRASSEARDLDVLMARVDEEAPAKTFRPELEARRQTAQAPLAELFARMWNKDRLRLRVPELLAGLTSQPTATLRGWAPQALREPASRFLEALRDSDRSFRTLHRLRLRGKRLRYALEVLAGALPIGPLERAYKSLVETQDLLGAMNDRVVAGQLWRVMAEDRDDAARHTLEELVDASCRAAADSRDAFLRRWSAERHERLAAQLETLIVSASSAP